MRIFAAILAVALILLQYRLWLSDQGFREVTRLQTAVDAQRAANHEQSEHNRQLGAEVNNLKVGLAALEERARSELGMVGASETFYQVVATTTPAPAASATAVSARTISARAE
jgi:cell division protein FtsB